MPLSDILTIAIPVKNEALNLPDCLKSVREFSHIVIVDSGSADATCEIARAANCEVVSFHWDGRFPKKRNWLLRNYPFKTPWVLFLDADERMTEAVVKELETVLPDTKHDAFLLRYDNWFMGRLLRHGDFTHKTALLRIGHGAYEKISECKWSSLDMEIHEQLVVEGTVGVCKARLEHHDRRSLKSYYARHNEYSSWEAKRFAALKDFSVLTGRQKLKYGLLCRKWFPWAYFLAGYLFKGGFLDGAPGYYFALGKMFYFSQVQAKIREAKR